MSLVFAIGAVGHQLRPQQVDGLHVLAILHQLDVLLLLDIVHYRLFFLFRDLLGDLVENA